MFQVIEKDGQLMPVHSKRDLDYMISRGWKIPAKEPIKFNKIEPIDVPVFIKRKYTKRGQK